MSRTLTVAAAAALAAAGLALTTSPLAASAYTAVAVPQPAGASCTAVKIASKQYTGANWAVMNCSNNLAYNIKNKAIVTQLALPAGATAEYASDISENGKAVGWVIIGGIPKPYHWKPNGVAVAYVNVEGAALGIVHTGIYVVGAIKKSAPLQAYSFAPGHFIGPGGSTNTDVAYDVSQYTHNIVGEVNNVAAANLYPGALAPIPGLSAPSVTYAVMDKDVMVGYQGTGGACGSISTSSGFSWQWSGPPPVFIAPLAGDCAASSEDINDNYGIVGWSSQGIAGTQRATADNVIGLPGGNIDLNSLAGHPWLYLTDAPGIDDQDSIIATDGGASPSQVWIID